MYGVIIEKGPQDWQIIQQTDGFASVMLQGRVEIEEPVLSQQGSVVVRAVDEENGTRVAPPVFCPIEDGHWQARLCLPAGGPYRIESYLRFGAQGQKRGDRRFHVGVGDNYIIAGQSNAVGVGKDGVNDPVNPRVHQYRLYGRWDIAAHPLHDTTDTRYPEFAESVETGHSPWLSFAKILAARLGYPIGLIPATKGGIPLSFWDRREDGRFFAHMLCVLRDSGGGARGILWYHGCNDVFDPGLRTTYFARSCHVFSDMRRELGGLPIIAVQLNKSTCTGTKDPEPIRRGFAEIREAQRRAADEIPDVHLVPSIDLPVCDGIHNAAMANLVIGQRAANSALRYIYHREVICDAPQIVGAVLIGAQEVALTFTNVYDRLYSDENPVGLLPFSLTDAHGRMLPDSYVCENDRLRLRFPRPIESYATVSCDGFCEAGLIPYDQFSYLPIVPFDRIPVRIPAKNACSDAQIRSDGSTDMENQL